MTRRFVFRSSFAATVSACALWSICAPAPLLAQSPQPPIETAAASDPPAHVSFVDGAAVLERDGQPDTAPTNMPLLAGDRLRTQGGRVEILFADGSALHLDANTTLDFQSDELVRLLDGRIRLSIPGPDRQVAYRVDAASATALIDRPGEYRLSILHGERDGEIELAVIRGAAELVNDDGRTPLRAGERAYARASGAPSYAYVFNSAAWDSFDRWSEARRDERLGISAQYLPEEVRPYAPALDQYGAWRYDSSYGYVWYPRVAVDWRPYYHGRWVSLRPYGWTWVGLDRWSWPTHHYGRWGFSAGAWFWIPGRSWGPAWVSWAYAPGYVSWCPLGFNNRPVLQIVNINRYGRGYDPWRAWTSVSRRHFGVDYVNVHYVAGRAFDARTRQAFVPRSSGPDIRGYTVPRSTAPIRSAGASPSSRRPASPVYTNLEPGASRVGSGGQRVIVGSPRSSVSPDAARGNLRAGEPVRRMPSSAGAAGATDRERPAPLSTDRDRTAPRAVPRDNRADRATPYRAAPSPDRTYAPSVQRSLPARPGVSDQGPDDRQIPSERRAPERRNPAASTPREYRPYGYAVPRAPESVRPSDPGPRPYSAPQRMTPEAAPPAPPASRPPAGAYGGAQPRGRTMERPSGPPPQMGHPAPAPRSGPAVSSPGGNQDNRGAGQSRPRGGGQSTGSAVPRRGR